MSSDPESPPLGSSAAPRARASTSDIGPAPNNTSTTSPTSGQGIGVPNPEMLDLMTKLAMEDAEEMKRTGENPAEKIWRERSQWARDDARSAKLKEIGNAAFKQGDYKKAFVVYSACISRTPHLEVYSLNRAAAGLKLRLYTRVLLDAKRVVDDPRPSQASIAKAYFRAGQAGRALGNWDFAEGAFGEARNLAPGDASVLAEITELERIRVLPDDERTAWVEAQEPRNLEDVFGGEDTFERLVKEQVDVAEALPISSEEFWDAMM
ncbi:hypothetical protein EXIGLDRAFT_836241 [Exidia glandulosa HHB12029]|uniref:TPR-like protein n=1 Tax=Exidia glandulosa HHB12029 TaxID=1314781 RepID=A0A165I0J5_EXIGL|nr:hypothetical protein EXIGLDRAFT_836241 [Exidia glandulosa HHB12029]